jgi:hypothetical protein
MAKLPPQEMQWSTWAGRACEAQARRSHGGDPLNVVAYNLRVALWGWNAGCCLPRHAERQPWVLRRVVALIEDRREPRDDGVERAFAGQVLVFGVGRHVEERACHDPGDQSLYTCTHSPLRKLFDVEASGGVLTLTPQARTKIGWSRECIFCFVAPLPRRARLLTMLPKEMGYPNVQPLRGLRKVFMYTVRRDLTCRVP